MSKEKEKKKNIKKSIYFDYNLIFVATNEKQKKSGFYIYLIFLSVDSIKCDYRLYHIRMIFYKIYVL